MRIDHQQKSLLLTLPSKRWEWICLVLGGVAFLYLLLMPSVTTRLVDFPVYHLAGQKALAHQTVYDVSHHFQYKYSPLIAWIFGWISGDREIGWLASVTHRVNVIGILALFSFWASRYGKENGLKRFTSPLPLALLAFAFCTNALKHELQLGQINFLPIALMTLFIWLKPERSLGILFLSALVLSVAVQLKLFALVLLIVPAFRRQWLFFPAFLLIFPATLYFPMAGIHGHEFAMHEIHAWLLTLTQSTAGLLAHAENVSTVGALSKIFGADSIISRGIWLTAGVAYVMDWFRTEWNEPSDYRMLCRSLLAVVLFNPLVWSYWVWFLGPLLILLFDRRLQALGILLLAVTFHAQSSALNRNWGIVLALYFVFALSRQPLHRLEQR